MCGPDGRKLSKRQLGMQVEELRSSGYFPLPLINFVKASGGGFSPLIDQNNLFSLTQLIENVSEISVLLDFC